jgi:Cu-Zn family superoxide dismutase
LLSAVNAKRAIAKVEPDLVNPLGKNVTGEITFEQATDKDLVKITARITGLTPNTTHGWHIHNTEILNKNCTTGGGHWNPTNVTHGAPDAEVRHYGDLGNIKANAQGVIEVTMTDRLVTLFGNVNAIARGIVIHEKEDDLGKGGNAGSLAVGNSGSRLGCGNIVILPDTPSAAPTQPVITTSQAAAPTITPGYESKPVSTPTKKPEPAPAPTTGYGKDEVKPDAKPNPAPATGYGKTEYKPDAAPAPATGNGYNADVKPEAVPAPDVKGYHTDVKPAAADNRPILSSAQAMAPLLSYFLFAFM